MADMTPAIALQLEEVGIYAPSHLNELDRRLVAALDRTAISGRGAQLVAMQWVFGWDMGRAGKEFADAKAAYEVLTAMHEVKFRDAGERSGEMCGKRAAALPDVNAANLRYRLAEQLERLARKRLDTIKNQIEVWRSMNANEREADRVHAHVGT
ncbi:hypothetical protein [Cryobacterium psychrophilum]|uniref:Uncharacterized protein n=1 Tax=Cryobacterium psychrophilum TaxID=41988 RepID=A0A4Y8KR82_9MICO|nr:hypothetical protein [Cryobacterium psychrophilum]TDW30990.1 hypothetical protein EDD25_2778 [Cryobacterium psychrophilum]TFD80852.1 hypothetical protein E3T53_04305 [Cryobacterium psychrophilum]